MFIKCLLCAENSHFCCFFLGHTWGGVGWDGVDFLFSIWSPSKATLSPALSWKFPNTTLPSLSKIDPPRIPLVCRAPGASNIWPQFCPCKHFCVPLGSHLSKFPLCSGRDSLFILTSTPFSLSLLISATGVYPTEVRSWVRGGHGTFEICLSWNV